jgi:hypothetical protein
MDTSIYENTTSDLFAISPFYREMIILDSYCKDEPDIPFSEYSVFVFNSLLEPKLRKHFEFVSMVLHDIPYDGKMVSTVRLVDKNNDFISLKTEDIKLIQKYINEIVKEDSSFFLFSTTESINIFRPWTRLIFPYMTFNRFNEERNIIPISKKVENGKIYLDLSDDSQFDKTTSKLYPDFIKTIYDLYYNGMLPNGKNLETFSGYDGEQLFETISKKNGISIPNYTLPSNKLSFSPDLSIKNTVYEFVFNKAITNPFDNEVGSVFLKNIRKFLEADIINLVNKGNKCEISMMKNNKFIESNINIKELFGYIYFTDKIVGLLVLQKLNLLSSVKLIEDDVSGKIGLFVPMFVNGEQLLESDLNLLLDNYSNRIDIYNEDIEYIKDIANRFNLNIVGEVELNDITYLFIEKDNLVTQRSILRSENGVNIFIDGNWMDKDLQEEQIDEIIKKIYNKDIIKGPYSTYYLNFMSREEIDNFEKNVEDELHNIIPKSQEKYNYFAYG